MELKKISLEDIVIKQQSRETFQEEGIKALARSLAEVGQIQPVVVKKCSEEGYILIAGERRIRALQESEQDQVLALIVKDEVPEEDCRLIQLAENIQREDLNPLEKAGAIKAYMELEGLNKQEASQRLGLPRTTLTEWLNILEVKEPYQKKVVENFYNGESPLTLSHISLAKSLDSKTQDPTKKYDLLNQVLQHRLSREETRKVASFCVREPALTVEEATAAVLISRERKKIDLRTDEDGEGKVSVEELQKALQKAEELLEELMDKDPESLQEKSDDLLQGFIYLFRLFQENFPELKKSAFIIPLKDDDSEEQENSRG